MKTTLVCILLIQYCVCQWVTPIYSNLYFPCSLNAVISSDYTSANLYYNGTRYTYTIPSLERSTAPVEYGCNNCGNIAPAVFYPAEIARSIRVDSFYKDGVEVPVKQNVTLANGSQFVVEYRNIPLIHKLDASGNVIATISTGITKVGTYWQMGGIVDNNMNPTQFYVILSGGSNRATYSPKYALVNTKDFAITTTFSAPEQAVIAATPHNGVVVFFYTSYTNLDPMSTITSYDFVAKQEKTVTIPEAQQISYGPSPQRITTFPPGATVGCFNVTVPNRNRADSGSRISYPEPTPTMIQYSSSVSLGSKTAAMLLVVILACV